MPLTCFCKTCGREVPVGEICSVCCEKLKPASARLYWESTRLPVLDWMCWNAILRIALPVYLATNVVIILLEFAVGGLRAVEALLASAYGRIALLSLVLLLLGTGLTLLLRGRETLCCWLDQRGLHVAVRLENLTPLHLLARGLPSNLAQRQREGQPQKVSETQVKWREVQRIQLWRQRGMILVYAPRYWQRLALPWPYETWQEAVEEIGMRLGKRKENVLRDISRKAKKRPRLTTRFGKRKGNAKPQSKKLGAQSAKKSSAGRKGKTGTKAKPATNRKQPAGVSIEEIIAMNEEEARRQAQDSARESRKRR